VSNPGTISTHDLRRLRIGMDEDQIVAILGKPRDVLLVHQAKTPSAVFGELGSGFRFPDVRAEVVWTYQHATRSGVTYCLGLKDGRLLATWRVTGKER
jgi:hypothetical protein